MSPAGIETGLTATFDRTVGQEDTAEALGSGSLPVLGTPRADGQHEDMGGWSGS